MDDLLRLSERRWRSSGAWADKLLYNVAMVRAGNIPPPDLEIRYLWDHQKVVDFRQSLPRYPQRLLPEQIKWEPVVGTSMQWFRRWHFPSGVGLSAAYNMDDPLPGRAPIIATVELERHEIESVLFTFEEAENEQLDAAYEPKATRQVIIRPDPLPTPHFLTWSVSRFLLSDEITLLEHLQIAGLRDLDSYKKNLQSNRS